MSYLITSKKKRINTVVMFDVCMKTDMSLMVLGLSFWAWRSSHVGEVRSEGAVTVGTHYRQRTRLCVLAWYTGVAGAMGECVGVHRGGVIACDSRRVCVT